MYFILKTPPNAENRFIPLKGKIEMKTQKHNQTNQNSIVIPTDDKIITKILNDLKAELVNIANTIKG